jgi:hypothetical protein
MGMMADERNTRTLLVANGNTVRGLLRLKEIKKSTESAINAMITVTWKVSPAIDILTPDSSAPIESEDLEPPIACVISETTSQAYTDRQIAKARRGNRHGLLDALIYMC